MNYKINIDLNEILINITQVFISVIIIKCLVLLFDFDLIKVEKKEMI